MQLLLLCISHAPAQRIVSPFGPVSEIVVDFIPGDVCVLRSKLGTHVAVSSNEKPLLHLFVAHEDGRLSLQTGLSLPEVSKKMKDFDLDADGMKEIILLHRTSMSILSFDKKENALKTARFPGEAADFDVADINGDKSPDLLLFGKNTAGITTLLHKGEGRYVEGPVLFPEISVSDLVTTDLNGDGITDILVLNWLSNQLAVFLGIGRGVFSEQITLDLPGEPGTLALSPVSTKREFRLVLTIPEQKTLLVFDGDALGDFQQTVAIRVSGEPRDIQFIDADMDKRFDIVASTSDGIVVSLGIANGGFADPILLGAAGSNPFYDIGDVNGDRLPDVAAADTRLKRIVVMWNSRSPMERISGLAYCVGASPTGLTTRDFNGDGRIDIGVVNSGSSSFSVLYNTKAGSLLGQQVFEIGEGPHLVRTASVSGGLEKTVVISHTASDQITVFRLTDDQRESRSFLIPTDKHPFVVYAKDDEGGGKLEMLVRSRKSGQQSISLSLFQQLESGDFLEKSIRSSNGGTFAALMIENVPAMGTFDLVAASIDRKLGITTISTARGDASFSFSPVEKVFSFQDRNASTSSLLAGLIDGDKRSDLIILQGDPDFRIGISLATGENMFSDSLVWIYDVNPIHEDAILIKDVNSDDKPDIVIADGSRKAVVVYYSLGGGSFEDARTVVEGDDIRAIRVAPLRRQTQLDLVIAHERRGVISIIENPFRQGMK